MIRRIAFWESTVHLLRRFCAAEPWLLLALATTSFAPQPAYADDLDATMPNCSAWLAQADPFYDDCKLHARAFSRIFYPSGVGAGQEERHFVLFGSSPENSHFVVGCALRSNRSLSFLGLYYTAQPEIIPVANSLSISGITPDGDVTLQFKGFPATLIAVRPFVTNSVRGPWNHNTLPPSALNCENPLSADGYYHGLYGRLLADFSRFGAEGLIDIGTSPGTRKPISYLELYGTDKPRDVLYEFGLVFLIESSGSILVRQTWWDSACKSGDPGKKAQSPWLFHQLCRLQGKINPASSQ